jgi:hypothetical protein
VAPLNTKEQRRLKQICYAHADREIAHCCSEEIERVAEVEKLRWEYAAEFKRLDESLVRSMHGGAAVDLLARRYKSVFRQLVEYQHEQERLEDYINQRFEKLWHQCYERGLRIVR